MNRQEIYEVVMQCLTEILPQIEGLALAGDERFVDLGANSTDRAELIALTLESLRLNIPRVEAFGPQTVNALVDFLHGKLAAS